MGAKILVKVQCWDTFCTRVGAICHFARLTGDHLRLRQHALLDRVSMSLVNHLYSCMLDQLLMKEKSVLHESGVKCT